MSQHLRSFKSSSPLNSAKGTQKKENHRPGTTDRKPIRQRNVVDNQHDKIPNFDYSPRGLGMRKHYDQSQVRQLSALSIDKYQVGKNRRYQEKDQEQRTMSDLKNTENKLSNIPAQNRVNLRASIPDISIQSNRKISNVQYYPRKTFASSEKQQNTNVYDSKQQATERIMNSVPKVLTIQMLQQAETQRIFVNNVKLPVKNNEDNEESKIQSIIQVLAVKNRTDLIDILQTFCKLAQPPSTQYSGHIIDNEPNQQDLSQTNKNKGEEIEIVLLELDDKINGYAQKNTKFQHFMKLFKLKQKRLMKRTKLQFQQKMEQCLSHYENQLNQIVGPLMKLKSTIQDISQTLQLANHFCEKTKQIDLNLSQKKMQPTEQKELSLIDNLQNTNFNSPQNSKFSEIKIENEQKKQDEIKPLKWKQKLQNLLSSIKNKTYTRRQRCNSIQSNDIHIMAQLIQSKQQSKQSQKQALIKLGSRENELKQQTKNENMCRFPIKPFKIENQPNGSMSSINAILGQGLLNTLIPDSMKTINNIYHQFKFIYRFLLQILYYEQSCIITSRQGAKQKSKYHHQLKQQIDSMYSNFSKIKVQVQANTHRQQLSDYGNLHLMYTQIQSLNLFIHKCTIKVPEIRKLWKKSIKPTNVITIEQLETVQQEEKENTDTTNTPIVRSLKFAYHNS